MRNCFRLKDTEDIGKLKVMHNTGLERKKKDNIGKLTLNIEYKLDEK